MLINVDLWHITAYLLSEIYLYFLIYSINKHQNAEKRDADITPASLRAIFNESINLSFVGVAKEIAVLDFPLFLVRAIR